jgi:hypothetical protein
MATEALPPLLRMKEVKGLKKLYVFEALSAWNTRLPKSARSVSQFVQDDECWNSQTFKDVRKPGSPAHRYDFKNTDGSRPAFFSPSGRMRPS